MILREQLKSLGEHRDLIAFDERGAGADALLVAAAGVQRDGRDAVVHHLLDEVGALEARIAVGEIESVGDRLSEVFVVCDVEACCEECVLHQLRLATVFENVVTVVVDSVVDSFQNACESVLCRVCDA